VSDPFGHAYARAYDALYEEKDYESECDLLLDVLQKAGGGNVRRVLDLGSGTGSHALVLAGRGLDVVGIDRSAGMTEIARQKAAALPTDGRPEFVTADIRDARLDTTFDAVLMMFAVLGYQHTNAEVLDALATARAHLEAGGLFAFDVWYGPAVLSERPSERVKVIETAAGKIIRVAAGSLDERHHLCTVDYRLWTLEGAQLVEEVTESHAMRYFFPLELELFLDRASFSLLRLGAFPGFATEPASSTWNVLALARAH
jgi:SAM-dependent methyltransferase